MFCFPFFGYAKVLCKIHFLKVLFSSHACWSFKQFVTSTYFPGSFWPPVHWNRERWCYSQLLLILAVNALSIRFFLYNFVFLVCLWFVHKCYINNHYELLNLRCSYLQISHTNPCTHSCLVALHIAAICFEFNKLACLHEDILTSFLKKVLKTQAKKKAQMLFLGITELQSLCSVFSNGCFCLL